MENNTLGYWVWFLFIGGVIGWLVGLVIRDRGFGIIADIAIGILGAILGVWMTRVIVQSTGSLVGAFLLVFVDAVVLMGLMRLVVRQVAA